MNFIGRKDPISLKEIKNISVRSEEEPYRKAKSLRLWRKLNSQPSDLLGVEPNTDNRVE